MTIVSDAGIRSAIRAEFHRAFPGFFPSASGIDAFIQAVLIAAKPLSTKMLIDGNWLTRHTETDPDCDTEASSPDPKALAWKARAERLEAALEEIIPFLEDRADAQYFTDSAAPVGNAAMHLLVQAQAALAKPDQGEK